MALHLNEQKIKSCGVIDETITVLRDIDANLDLDYLENIKNTIKKDNTLVIVCGECNVGKSSLLTELIGEDGLFPVNADVATNIITILKYGSEERISVVLEGGRSGKKKFQEKRITREEIVEYSTEQKNKGNSKNATIITIELPNAKLKNGLVLVDTPGVGGLDKAHSAVTASFLPEADAIIYASEASKPLDTYELEFIRDNVKSNSDNVLFLLTKSDMMEPIRIDAIKTTNKEKIMNYTGWKEEDIIQLSISALSMKNYRERGKNLHYKVSNFEEMNRYLKRMTTDRRIMKLIIPNMMKVREVALSQARAQVDKYNMIHKSAKNIEQYKQEINNKRLEKQELLKEYTFLKKELRRDVEEIYYRLGNMMKTRYRNNRTTIDLDTNGRKKFKKKQDIDQYLDNLNSILSGDFKDVIDTFKEEAEQLSNKLNRDLIGTIEGIEKKYGPSETDTSIIYNKDRIIGKTEGIGNALRGALLQGNMALTGTSVGGYIVGTVLTGMGLPALLPIIGAGALIAAVTAGISAFIRGIKNSKANNASVANTSAHKMNGENKEKLNDFLVESKRNLLHTLNNEIESRLYSKIEQIDNLLKELPSKAENLAQERETMLAITKARIERLKGILKKIDDILESYRSLAAKYMKINRKAATKSSVQKEDEHLQQDQVNNVAGISPDSIF